MENRATASRAWPKPKAASWKTSASIIERRPENEVEQPAHGDRFPDPSKTVPGKRLGHCPWRPVQRPDGKLSRPFRLPVQNAALPARTYQELIPALAAVDLPAGF